MDPLRILRLVLVAALALWGLIGALGNALDWDGTLAAVRTVTSMAAIQGGGDWRATSAPLIVGSGAAFILGAKLAMGVLCAVSVFRMARSLRAGPRAFRLAMRPAYLGCGIAVLMLFGGFQVIAEQWFELWRADTGLVAAPADAARYAAMILLIALFLAQPEG